MWLCLAGSGQETIWDFKYTPLHCISMLTAFKERDELESKQMIRHKMTTGVLVCCGRRQTVCFLKHRLTFEKEKSSQHFRLPPQLPSWESTIFGMYLYQIVVRFCVSVHDPCFFVFVLLCTPEFLGNWYLEQLVIGSYSNCHHVKSVLIVCLPHFNNI